MKPSSFRMMIGVTACLLTGTSASQTSAAQILISEIRIDQPGTDVDEYVEISGPPGFDLGSLTYLVIGDGTGGSGVVEMEKSLEGMVIPPDGFALVTESSFSLGPTPDLVTSLNFENGDNVTHLVVSGFGEGTGADLDVNDDGVLDQQPWSTIEDCLAIIDNLSSGERTYCPTTIGPDGGSAPFHVFRDGGWQIGTQTPTLGIDTPGTGPADLPIEVDDLEALVDGTSLRLRWTAVGELDITAFRVTRRGRAADETIGWLDIINDGLTSRQYELEIRDLDFGRHHIDLSSVFADGTEERVGSVSVRVPIYRIFRLEPPYPNPTTTSTTVTVHASITAALEISLTDVMGRQVASIFSGAIGPEERLDVKAHLERLPRGVYFAVARISGQRQVRPIVRL